MSGEPNQPVGDRVSRIVTLAQASWRRFAPAGGLARAVLLLGGATAATQAVSVLLAPIYARLYTPADYGILGVYSSIVAMALTVGCLCYETGIPVCGDLREAVGLTTISIVLVGLIGFMATAALGLQAIAGVGGGRFQLGGYVWLVPVGIVGAGLFRALRFWALRRQNMGAIARSAGSQLVGSTTIGLGFGVLAPSPLGLILANIAGLSLGTLGLARQTGWFASVRAETRTPEFGSRLWALARKYQRLPLISAPSTFFNSLGLYLPGLLLAPYFGADFAGQFFMALKVIGLPVGLLGAALSLAFFSSAAAMARERPRELARYFDRVFGRAIGLSLLILLAGIAAPWVVPWLLGGKWHEAGAIAFWLSLYNVIGLSVGALSFIPQIVGQLRGQFVMDLARAAAVFLLLFLGRHAGTAAMTVVKGYALVMGLYYAGLYFLYRYQVKKVARTGHTDWTQATAT